MRPDRPVAPASPEPTAEAVGCRRCASLEESLRNHDDELRAANAEALAVRAELKRLSEQLATERAQLRAEQQRAQALRSDYEAATERLARVLLGATDPAERAALARELAATLS